MKIRKYIRKIVDDGSQQEMEKLADILEEVIEDMQEFDPQSYNKYEMCLYKMAYGEQLTEELAQEIVNKMKPYGMRWSLDESEKIQRDYGMDNINPVDFFVVINSAFNDYRDLLQDDLSNYVKFTDAFINDEDAKKGKVFRYYTIIPK
jgi:hypothetical protein